MPELPEVENVRRFLAAALPGKKITAVRIAVPKLVPTPHEEFRRAVTGRTVTAVERRGKNLVIPLDRGYLLCHLKMSGRFLFLPAGRPAPPAAAWHVAFDFDGGAALYFHDLRRFGWIRFCPRDPTPTLRLGLEPLTPAFTPAAWRDLLAGRRTRLKQLLLDQEKIAGLGNIYVAEALFRAGINPERPAGSLKAAEQEALYHAIIAVLREAIAAGGTSIVDYQKPDGTPGSFQERLDVYRRHGQDCRRCRATVAVKKHGGRSTYYCPGCQS